MSRWSALRPRLMLGLLALALIGAVVFVMMRAGPLAPTRVTVTRVASASVTPALSGIGTVEARRNVPIGPTAAGRVQAVHVDVGDAVKAGQLLAEMDPVDLDERLGALDASLARADSAIASTEAQRRDAQARQTLASANTQRYTELGRQNFISPGALDARQQEQTSAEAAVKAADAAWQAAQQDRRRLIAERAGLQQQRTRVRLLAPHDGVIVSRDAEPGATVVAGQAVLRLVDPATLWLRTRFDQGRSGGLAAGLPAGIVLRSAPDRSQPGRVLRVELLGDSVTEERTALVGFERLPAGLSIGELAEVTLTLPAAPAAPVVPNASLRQRQGRSGVWRLDGDGRPAFTPVRTGATSLDGQVQILDGLQAGDTVVVHSDKELTPGARLRVVESLIGQPS